MPCPSSIHIWMPSSDLYLGAEEDFKLQPPFLITLPHGKAPVALSKPSSGTPFPRALHISSRAGWSRVLKPTPSSAIPFLKQGAATRNALKASPCVCSADAYRLWVFQTSSPCPLRGLPSRARTHGTAADSAANGHWDGCKTLSHLHTA